MSHQASLVMVWLGALGLVEFGGLWLTARYLDGEIVGAHTRALAAAGVRRSRRRRVEHWIRVAPLLTGASAALVICGAISAWVMVL